MMSTWKNSYSWITPEKATQLEEIKDKLRAEDIRLRKKRDKLCRLKNIEISEGESLNVKDHEILALNKEIQKVWDTYCIVDEALTAYNGLPMKKYMPYGEWYGYAEWLKKLGVSPDKGYYYDGFLRSRFNRTRH